jgi:hypothetical protein
LIFGAALNDIGGLNCSLPSGRIQSALDFLPLSCHSY